MAFGEITEFLFPAQLVRHAGATRYVGAQLRGRGVAVGTVFIVADRFVHDAGMTASLIAGLQAAGFTAEVFAQVMGEPDLEMVEEAAAIAGRLQAVAVIGFGGGSALDTAKLVSYQLAAGAALAQFKGPLPHVAGLPTLVMIPTTTGTGAEATRVAMFTVNGAKRAVLTPQFVPDLAVLDSDLVIDLPRQVLAATALDALSHAIESMMSTTSNDLTWIFSGEAARRIFAHLRSAYGGDTDARSELLFASFLAGVSLNAGVTLGHSMSYVMAARHKLPHGVGCALALPYCLAYNQTMDEDAGRRMAALILQRPEATLQELAQAVSQLTTDVGLPTDIGSLSADDESVALGAAVAHDYPRPTNPVALDPERLGELFTYLRAGDLLGAWDAMGVSA